MHQQMVFSLFTSDQSDTWVDLLIVFVLWPGVYCTQWGVCDTLWLSTVWQSRLKYLNNNFMACHYSLYWHLWSSEDESSNGFRSPQVPHTGISSLSKITQWFALKFAADIYFALRTIIVIAFHLLPSSQLQFVQYFAVWPCATSNYTFSCHECQECKSGTNWVSDREQEEGRKHQCR